MVSMELAEDESQLQKESSAQELDLTDLLTQEGTKGTNVESVEASQYPKVSYSCYFKNYLILICPFFSTPVCYG